VGFWGRCVTSRSDTVPSSILTQVLTGNEVPTRSVKKQKCKWQEFNASFDHCLVLLRAIPMRLLSSSVDDLKKLKAFSWGHIVHSHLMGGIPQVARGPKGRCRRKG
jgi:hypothetical protein